MLLEHSEVVPRSVHLPEFKFHGKSSLLFCPAKWVIDLLVHSFANTDVMTAIQLFQGMRGGIFLFLAVGCVLVVQPKLTEAQTNYSPASSAYHNIVRVGANQPLTPEQKEKRLQALF